MGWSQTPEFLLMTILQFSPVLWERTFQVLLILKRKGFSERKAELWVQSSGSHEKALNSFPLSNQRHFFHSLPTSVIWPTRAFKNTTLVAPTTKLALTVYCLTLENYVPLIQLNTCFSVYYLQSNVPGTMIIRAKLLW